MLITRIEQAISKLETQVDSTYNTFSTRHSNLIKQIGKVSEEISVQQQAYSRYLQQANSVGLSESWAKKVRNGEIDISIIQDEDLAEKINEYSKWYNKAVECQEAITELSETEKSLYETSFEMVATEYESILSLFEHKSSMIEKEMEQAEALGYMASGKYYEALKSVELDNLSQLTKEQQALTNALSIAVKEGDIKEGSEAWYSMKQQINEVTEAILDAENALIDYNNEIRQIQWDTFDYLQESISKITDESDFLIDLMQNKQLYNKENGQLTDQGWATMGLHGLNYNTNMEQSKWYAVQIDEINKQIANNPYDTALLERKSELIEQQQEFILAAEQEKDAIKDMVEEGINLELDALEKLINKYTDALDAQKNLYDYQKKVKDQTEEISSIQKQLTAYAGDTSEESKAKIQELKVSLEDAKESLEETQYDQYISDQKQLLDELYTEYELILNERLDNIDALISDMIQGINNNASSISETLALESYNVGFTLSEEMNRIWTPENIGTSGINTTLTTYGDAQLGKLDSIIGKHDTQGQQLTALQTTISSISDKISTLITSADKKTASVTNSIVGDYTSKPVTKPNSTSSNKTNTTTNKTTTSNTSTSNKTTSTSSSTTNKNFFVYKKDSYPKNKLNINTSIVDRLKYHNYNSSMSVRAKYYQSMGLGSSSSYRGTAAQNTAMINWMKRNGYKNGVYNLKESQYAFTQEVAPEAIVQRDGSVLMPLTAGTSVLNGNATKNLYDFMNNPLEYINGLVSYTPDIPITKSVGNQIETNLDLTLNLPNVKNYEEFKQAMVKDKNFEKFIQSITTDRMLGKSSLAKYSKM